jgi:hypothetical protein
MWNKVIQACTICMSFASLALPANSTSETELFTNFKISNWEPRGSAFSWTKNVMVGKEEVVLATFFANGKVLLAAHTKCENQAATMATYWIVGEEFGYTVDCADKVKISELPLRYEKAVGELPFVMEQIIWYERRMMFARERPLLIRS